MNPIIRHRLYLTARYCAALLAFVVIVPLAISGVHDYAVQRIDARCFHEQWTDAIMQARKKDAETQARNCTPEVLKVLEARKHASRPGTQFDPDAYLAQERPLSIQEEQCFWARSGEIVALSTDEMNQIAIRCNVQVETPGVAQDEGFVPVPRYREDQMVADLQQARSLGDKKLEERISSLVREGRASLGSLKLIRWEDLPDDIQRVSTRAWRPRQRQGHRAAEDAVITL